MTAKNGFPWKREIGGVLLFALGVYILLSLYVHNTGTVGYHIRRWTELTLGRTGFAWAVALIYCSLRLLRGTLKRISVLRAAGFFLFLAAVSTVYHIGAVYYGHQLPPSLAEELLLARGAQFGQGSGVVGAVLMTGSLTAFGLQGSYVILSGLMAAGLLLWWHVSLWQLLKTLVAFFGRQLAKIGRAVVRALRRQTKSVKDQRQSKRDNAAVLGGQTTPAAAAGSTRRSGVRWEQGKLRRKSDKPSAGSSKEHSSPPRPDSANTNSAGQERSAVPAPEPKGPIKIPAVKGDRYQLPPLQLLNKKTAKGKTNWVDHSEALAETFQSFGIEAKVVHVSRGPVVTRYELQPARGIKVSKITSLADDIALALAASDVRIEAPVPGKSVVGIEVPNAETQAVLFREVLENSSFLDHPSKVSLALGKDIAGKPVLADLKKWLHLLVAGATGSGKSVCLNAMIASILFKALPDEVKLLMIDPKRVELAVYDGIPHLIAPVITDPKKAAAALRWAVAEMERRYKLFEQAGVRNIELYQEWILTPAAADKAAASGKESWESLPFMVIVIDELADLMMVAATEVEDAICRLAQMARAAGMYLIIATQRPSVDVITGLIKANVPSRIAFAVSSQVDSRTILDMGGAERLIGKGDMLFHPLGLSKPVRAQGAWISDKEIEALTGFWKQQGEPQYEETAVTAPAQQAGGNAQDDELLDDAVRLVVDTGQASISLLQRRFRIGYSRAARLIDMMELRGVVGGYQGSKPREVLIDSSDLEGERNE